VSHSAGAVFRHGVSGRDFDEANSHVNDSTNDVHSQYVTKSLIANSKGSLITSTGSAVAALSVGTNGQGLIADSAVTNGIKWATVVQGDGITAAVALTQAAYDALTPNSTTLYVITD
jgi:hypothetical protein